MDRTYIVAPSFNVARYYIDRNHMIRSQCIMMIDGFDAEKLRGLRNVTIKILNRYTCNERIIEELLVRAQIANLNLEFQNV